MDTDSALEKALQQSAALHRHLCPRQVLGVRMGILAGRWLGLEMPRADKRVFVIMETDGCASDGVAAATGAWVGRRTMRVVDFGKVAATFVDTADGSAVRIHPHSESRARAVAAMPQALDRWHAQLLGYQRLRDEDFLIAEPVALTVDVAALISRPGARTVCSVCGEEVLNERQVLRSGQEVCRPCAGQAYCSMVATVPFAARLPSVREDAESPVQHP